MYIRTLYLISAFRRVHVLPGGNVNRNGGKRVCVLQAWVRAWACVGACVVADIRSGSTATVTDSLAHV